MDDPCERLKVLVVEDEILIRKYMVLLLENMGCTVVGETAYGEEAVCLAKEKKPGLVLMDIRLKGKMDGIEAAVEIGAQGDTAVLFMSAYNYQYLIEEEQIPNTIGYLKKPVDENELARYLKKLTAE